MPSTTVKDTARRQYVRFLDDVANNISRIKPPPEGWIKSMRSALRMSAPELATRMGITKPAIYQAERQERVGGITIQHMEKLAAAMGGEFVYAIVPKTRVEDIMRSQAQKKAEQIIRRASAHMALEEQSLTSEQLGEEIERLAEKLLRDHPSDFWEMP